MSVSEAIQKCADWCSQSEHCEFEVREKLQKYGVENDAIDKIICQLKEERYIDNSRYANYFAKDRARFNGWGPIKIKFQLSLKKIDTEIINDAISLVDSNIFEEQLRKVVQSKVKMSRQVDNQKLKASLLRLGYSRGFEYQMIARVVKLVLNESIED